MKIDNWKIFHEPILAVYSEDFLIGRLLLSVRTKSINENFVN